MVQNKFRRHLCQLARSVLGVLFVVSAASAETRWAEVELEGALKPEMIAGVIFSNTSSFQTSEARVSSSDSKKTIVAIPFDSDVVSQARFFAYAMVRTEDKALHYSTIVPANPQFDLASGYAQPACIPNDVPNSMQSQMSLVANLLKVRDKRRENIREQINTALSGEFLEKMLKYESGFGLQFGSPLSPDMPAADIADRLDRILHTLRKVAPRK